MSEYLSGEELWDKFDAIYCKHSSVRTRFAFSEIASVGRSSWNDLAAELKVPRPKVLTLVETWQAWSHDESIRGDEDGVEILRQRLNAAHEARREANP